MTLTELFSYIDTYINTKTGTDRISGAVDNMVRKQTITALIDIISSGFGGDLSSGDNPGTFTKPVYFIATETGIYNYCDGVEVTKLPAFIVFNGTDWSVTEFDVSAEVPGGNTNAKGVVTNDTPAPGSPEVGHWYVFVGLGTLNWPGQTINAPGIVYCTATNPINWNIETFEKQLGIGDITDLAKALQAANDAAANAQSAAEAAQTTADKATTAAGNAQGTADNATTLANKAQESANKAQATAETAQSAADSATTAVSEAQTAIDNHKNAKSGAHKASTIEMDDGSNAAAAILDKVSLTKDEEITGQKTFWKDIILGSKTEEKNLAIMNTCQDIRQATGDLYGYMEMLTSQDANMVAYIEYLKSDTNNWEGETISQDGTVGANYIGDTSKMPMLDCVFEGTTYKLAAAQLASAKMNGAYMNYIIGTLYNFGMNVVDPSGFIVPASFQVNVNFGITILTRLKNVPSPLEENDAVPKKVTDDLNKRITVNENRISSQETTVSTFADDISYSKGKVNYHEDRITNHETRISNNATRLGEHEKKIADNGGNISSHEAKIEVFEEMLQNIVDHIDLHKLFEKMDAGYTVAGEQKIRGLIERSDTITEEFLSNIVHLPRNQKTTIQPVLDNTNELTISLNEPESGKANKYKISFQIGGTLPTLILPSGVLWNEGNNITLSVNTINTIEYEQIEIEGSWIITASYKKYPFYRMG